MLKWFSAPFRRTPQLTPNHVYLAGSLLIRGANAAQATLLHVALSTAARWQDPA